MLAIAFAACRNLARSLLFSRYHSSHAKKCFPPGTDMHRRARLAPGGCGEAKQLPIGTGWTGRRAGQAQSDLPTRAQKTKIVMRVS